MLTILSILIASLHGLAEVPAADPQGRLIQETWDAAYLGETQAGYARTTVTELTRAGRSILHTAVDLHLTVRRERKPLALRMETGSEETTEGKVLAVWMNQYIDGAPQVLMRGDVRGEQLRVHVEGARRLDKRITWTVGTLGLLGQERLFKLSQVKPGDSLAFMAFEPTYTAIFAWRVEVKDYEAVRSPGGSASQRLLRVEARSDTVAGYQVPKRTLWLDSSLIPVRSETELPGIGRLTLVRTTRAAARKAPGALTNIGLAALIPTNHIAKPYDVGTAIYRITLRGDGNPLQAFLDDDRQEARKIDDHTIELRIRAAREPGLGNSTKTVGMEYLRSSPFINSADPLVRRYALDAIGAEIDDWRQALRIEHWVHDHMRKQSDGEVFAPADRVARSLRGDCKEYAMLTAAMCRAAGIPSRVAIGLIYVDAATGPAFGFHMWAEAFVHGRWMPLDSTLGRGFVGATHLKIADHSWTDVQSLTPLLPAIQVMGNASIEVVRTSSIK